MGKTLSESIFTNNSFPECESEDCEATVSTLNLDSKIPQIVVCNTTCNYPNSIKILIGYKQEVIIIGSDVDKYLKWLIKIYIAGNPMSLERINELNNMIMNFNIELLKNLI